MTCVIYVLTFYVILARSYLLGHQEILLVPLDAMLYSGGTECNTRKCECL